MAALLKGWIFLRVELHCIGQGSLLSQRSGRLVYWLVESKIHQPGRQGIRLETKVQVDSSVRSVLVPRVEGS